MKSSKLVRGWLARYLLYVLIFEIIIALGWVSGTNVSMRELMLDLNPARPASYSTFVQEGAVSLFERFKVFTANDHDIAIKRLFGEDESDVLYYSKNMVTGKEFTNMPDWDGDMPPGEFSLIFYSYGDVNEYYKGDDRFYRSIDYYPDSTIVAYMWVSGSLDAAGHSSIFANAARALIYYRLTCCGVVAALMFLLIASIASRKSKKAADRRVAGVTRRVWIEFKLLTAFVFAALAVGILTDISSFDTMYIVLGMFMPFALLWLSICAADFRHNKSGIFRHNSISFVVGMWRRFINKAAYQKRLWLEFFVIFFIEVTLLAAAMLCFIEIDFVIVGIFLLCVFAGVMIPHARRCKRYVGDLGRLEKFASELKGGRLEHRLDADENALLYPVLSSVSGIYDGFAAALRAATKSERMRAELVTNVSHDLKTPLTSIISYVELLRRMELPDEAKSHVEVLSSKSERLKVLIQDLFELAKTAGGETELLLETLDFARLTEQTLSDADADEHIFRVSLSDRPLWITGDGAKLSRVLQNLFDNAKKYAMPGTRVYVGARREKDRVAFEIKNVAGYEMAFDPGEVAERFVRGDASRNTEGSGLGLAIARGYTEACGGTLEVGVDGDVFRVRLTFPYRERMEKEPPAQPPALEAFTAPADAARGDEISEIFEPIEKPPARETPEQEPED
ncbi:MAG: HAMP domain-containing histidine kinase [Oscillospiraceae bacterium]|nr:HAMP domain-containing histidine kinase [Oscillospiraceae bacterium]